MTKPNNAICQGLLDHVDAHPDVEPYSKQRNPNGTRKVSSFETIGGIFFAIDKGIVSKTPIWMTDIPPRRSALESLGIEYDLYAEGDPRNSNIFKLPGFKTGPLIRAFPDTLEQAKNIVAMLAR